MSESESNENDSDEVDAAVETTVDAIEAHIRGVCEDIPVAPEDPADLREAVREDLAYAARNASEFDGCPEAYRCEEYRVVAADDIHLARIAARLDAYEFDAGTFARLVYGRACESDWDWARDEDGGVARVVPRVGGDDL